MLIKHCVYMVLVLVVVLTSCTTTEPTEPTQPEATLNGSVQLNVGNLKAQSGLPIHTMAADPVTTRAGFVAGEVIIKFRSGIDIQSLGSLQIRGTELIPVRRLGLENTQLYRATPLTAATAETTLEFIHLLNTRADIEWAQPNTIIQPMAAPNDPALSYQWHYPAIDLAQAWELETGNSNPVTVAVIDSGVLYDHPDLAGQLLPGYDFIDDPEYSNDGDGRDADANDPGNNPGGQSSYHGSHVAGTIAAATNNGLGIAGVSWGAKILPVRVLGVGGGTTADLIDGMLWAAGIAIPGVPNNPNPAQILNLSLGGQGACRERPIYQETIDRVTATGAIIVVAAGNMNVDVSTFVPANCNGVITVGATSYSGARASYANYGTRIDLMAPGGEMTEDLDGDGYPDGVLSLTKDDESGQFAYSFANGTSMAAPHVAGVLALMKSKDADLSYSSALAILKQTAHPLGAAACSGQGPSLTTEQCGAGLIDAAAALRAVSNGPDPAPQPSFSMSLSPSTIQVQPGSSVAVAVTVSPVNGFSDAVSFSLQDQPAGVTGHFEPTGSGSILMVTAGNTVTPGTYPLTVQGSAGSITRVASLSLSVPGASRPTIAGTFVVACYYLNNTCDPAKSQTKQLSGSGTSALFGFTELPQGNYLVFGWKDSDDDGEINQGDYFGSYTEGGNQVLVKPGANGLSIALDLVTSDSAATFKDTLEHAQQAFGEPR